MEAFEDIDGALELWVIEVAEVVGFGVGEGVVAPPVEEVFLLCWGEGGVRRMRTFNFQR